MRYTFESKIIYESNFEKR